jgi:hypothetical protein
MPPPVSTRAVGQRFDFALSAQSQQLISKSVFTVPLFKRHLTAEFSEPPSATNLMKPAQAASLQ